MSYTKPDIAFLQSFSEQRGKLSDMIGQDKKDHKELIRGAQNLANKIFRQASFSELSPDDVIASVYITGLYHGAELERQRNGK